MNVLVTGAAGYIGSICSEVLLARGINVIALDNLQEGHREAVPQQQDGADESDGDWIEVQTSPRPMFPLRRNWQASPCNFWATARTRRSWSFLAPMRSI